VPSVALCGPHCGIDVYLYLSRDCDERRGGGGVPDSVHGDISALSVIRRSTLRGPPSSHAT
jgi:hypothetical protein